MGWRGTHTHTHTQYDLSLTLNGAVRLALNPEATQRGEVVVCLPAPGGQEEERSLEVFAGSSSAAGCLGFAAAKTNLPRSASALLVLRSVQLREE